jgi:hypothetical protein
MGNEVIKIENIEILSPLNSAVLNAINEIRDASAEASTAILLLAKTLHKWSTKKVWSEIESILDKEKIIHISVRKRLIKIGSNAVLMNEQHWNRLPHGYHHLYPLTQIDESRLEKLIESDKIYIGMTVNESNEIKNKFRRKKAPAPRKSKYLNFTIKIKVSSDKKGIQTVINSEFNKMKKTVKKYDSDAIIEMV